MSNTLYRKYRPQRFADVSGQKHIIRTLTSALDHDRVGHAYLFTGPRGTGKTTTARLLAKAITCSAREGAEPCLRCAHCLAMADNSSLDVLEIDAASNTGVDNIRELRDSIKLLPTQAAFKVYIIDEVHMLSIGAFNALLKTLEEPPKHVVFILATTSLHKVPETIISRCQRFDFSKLPLENISAKLSVIAEQEGVRIDHAAVEMIALAAEGGMRDAESLLMQVIALEDKEITSEEVSAILGISNQEHVLECLGFLADNDTRSALSLVGRLAENGTDLHIFADSLLHTLRQALIANIHNTPSDNRSSDAVYRIAETIGTARLVQLIELLQVARKEIRSASLPQLPLELAIVRFVIPESNASNGTESDGTPNRTATSPKTRDTSKATESATLGHAPTTSERVRESATAYVPETTTDTGSAEKTTEADTTTMETIECNWQIIIEKTRELNSSLALTLGNCRPLRLESDTIVLGTKFPMYKEKLSLPENRLTVENALGTILGLKTKIQVIIDESAGSSSVAEPASPLVAEAMSILGGKIVA